MNMRRWISGLLVATLIVTIVPMGQVEASETVPLVNQEVATISLGSVADQVESIVVNDVTLIEGTGGHTSIEYNPETGKYDGSYHYYSQHPQVTVTFKDGSTATGQYPINYNGETYYPSISTNQSYENQWGVGEHKATLRLLGKSVEFNYIITESPVASIVVSDVTLIEGTGGHTSIEYNPETGKYDLSYHYYSQHPQVTVTFKDGSTATGQSPINYNGETYYPSISTNQSYENQWGVGEHKATLSLLGKSVEFNYIITESPIESIFVEDISIPAYSNGYWSSSTPNDNDPYFHYIISPKVTVTYKDERVEEIDYYIVYDRERYYVNFTHNQYNSPWETGGQYEVGVQLMGKETTFTVEIEDSQYESVEVIKMRPVEENKNCHKDEQGNLIYDIPTFSYKVNLKDGSHISGIYDEEDEFNGVWNDGIRVSHTQEETPWTVGGENSFLLQYGDVQTVVLVEMVATDSENPGFEYLEQGGELYITSCSVVDDIVEIPETINGKTVVGIVSLEGAEKTAKKVVIPDTVKHIAEEVFTPMFSWWECLETVEIGSSVQYLDNDILRGVSGCEIIISQSNPYYCVYEGNVYDKEMITLVAFLNATYTSTGREYVVPETVVNIDAATVYFDVKIVFSENSTSYVTEDGITYSADKKKVVYCDPAKTGVYVMPNTVEEIGQGVFDSRSLKEITISKNVTEIVYGTFAYSSIEKVTLPDELKKIGELAFAGCSSMTSIELPNKLESIEGAAFANTGLTEIDIPDSVIEIKNSAFAGTDIESVSFGKGLKTIEGGAFSNTLLKELEVPDNVTFIGEYAFAGCYDLGKATVGKGISNLEDGTFSGNQNLKTVELKNESVSIGASCFSSCPLETINMEHVKGTIGLNAFWNTGLEEVTLAEGVTELVYGAFLDSKQLEKIDVPTSLTKVGGHVFDGTEWDASQDSGPVYLEHVFYNYLGTLQQDTLEIKDGTTVLADYSLQNQKKLEKVILPKGLKTIGDATFFGASGLKEITIPASVSYIGVGAFSNCESLEAINVDSDNPYFSSVDGVLFNKDGTELIWCPKRRQTTYEVPRSVEVIKANALSECGVTDIVIKKKDVVLEKFAIGIGYTYISGVSGSDGYNYDCITIHCFEDSTAQAYAEKYLMNVVLMEEKPISSVELNKTQVQLELGQSTVLTATINPADTTDDKTIIWTSDNPLVATVDNGAIKTVGIGTTTITVTTSNGKTAQCIVKVSLKAEWKKDQHGWWYQREDGSYPRNGWHEIEGDWYYFNASGYRTENQWIGSYYVNSDGVMVTNQWVGTYYVGADGRYISISRWLEIDGQWYYLNYGGSRSTGWQEVGGTWYYFDAQGVMATGEQTIGGTGYYFLSSGAMVTGWQAIGDAWYYYAGSGAQCTGWQAIGGTWYYFDEEGIMATGEQTIGGTGYYFLSNGAMATGWQAIGNAWYYYAGSGAQCTGWQAIGGTWYYFDAEGIMATGEQTIGGTGYYFLSSGAMATGWQIIAGEWYYFAGSGAMAKNQWVGNYYMLQDGVMATNQWIGNYYVGADGAWQPNAR